MTGCPHTRQTSGGSQKSSDQDKRSQSLVHDYLARLTLAPKVTHALPVADHGMHPKISNGKISHRLIKVIGLPIPFSANV
jgi:hypothetical protein